MNERIKELIKQATSPSFRLQGYGSEPTHIYPGTLDPEKFAELIVKECMWQVVKDNQVPQDIQVLIGGRFKQHFGVEE